MTTLALPADLGIENATSLKELLAPHLEQAGSLTLDASQASRLHCASLQLLAAFFQARQARGLATGLQPSPAMSQAIQLLGLAHILADAAPSPLTNTLNQERSA